MYSPAFMPGNAVTCVAKNQITAGQCVKISDADFTVELSTAGETKALGVAGRDAKAGEKLPVYFGKLVHRVVADTQVTPGGNVHAGPGGTFKGAEGAGAVFGVALSGGTKGANVYVVKL